MGYNNLYTTVNSPRICILQQIYRNGKNNTICNQNGSNAAKRMGKDDENAVKNLHRIKKRIRQQNNRL